MTKMDKINMILEVAEELGIEPKNGREYDTLLVRGFRYINESYSDEENRETLVVNL